MTPPATPALAALARHVAAMGEQPAVVFVDEGGHWKWKSWAWLGEEVAAAQSRIGTPRDADALWRPSLHGLVHALAAQAGDGAAAWSSVELVAATAALARPLARGERPIVTAPSELDTVEARAWLTWALESGAALVLPGDAAFLAWAIWWPRSTDALAGAGELEALRDLLASFGRARARRRQLARLRRLVVAGGVDAGERAAWESLGLALVPFPSAPVA